ncbi:MAG: eukaryotic cytochrome b561-domain-containing protein [Linnemannia elongata]|nr:MAG: eukaryotic cytochrome b561-domain-containing protein [Linnemannia elongata]
MHHHPSTASKQPSGAEDESSPLFVPSTTSAAVNPSSPQKTNVHTRSSSPSVTQYQSVSRSPSPKQNRTSPRPDDIHREVTEYSLPGSGSGSSTSSASSSSEDEDDQTATADRTRLQRPNYPHRHHHRHHRHTRVQKMLAVVAQLGLFIYFGTLIGVLTKAPWVYPYSWHPICMGLYGFVATEGILLLQPSEKGKQRAQSRTIHGLLLSLALVSAVIGFWAIYENKDRLGKEHFHTNHAYLGCTAVFVFAFQVLFGLSVAYAPKALYRRIGQARITRIHRVTGYISISLVWGTLWLAVVTNWVKKNFDQEWIFYLGVGMVAVGLVGQITPSRLYLTPKRSSAAL